MTAPRWWLVALVVTTGYLAAAWIVVFFFEIYQREPRWCPSFVNFNYYLFFREGSFTEVLQYVTLLLSAVMVAGILAHRYQRGELLSAGWALLLLGLVLLYIEDAHNTRHMLTALAGVDRGAPLAQAAIELGYYALLGGVMMGGLWWILKEARSPRVGITLFLVAYPTYGAIALASATRHIGEWYRQVGSWLLGHFPERIFLPGVETAFALCDPIDAFLFMDGMVEESIELLAAALLLAAVLVHYEAEKQRPNEVDK